jgi:prepilin-type N-terminal cleavage/methylation domain-containing protein
MGMFHFHTRECDKGFTLIELLVVISIISLLSSIIFAGLTQSRQKAYIAALKQNMHQIQTQIDIMRFTDNKYTSQITLNQCTFCSFTDGQPIMSDANALAINQASWVRLGFTDTPKDPWGRPYTLDENDGEVNTWPLCTVRDIVYSTGANGIWESFSNSNDQLTPPDILSQGLGDDYYFNVTFLRCSNP